MSVSWQPNFNPSYIANTLPVGGGLGSHSTSSGDYGNWFGGRPPIAFPLSRRIPTRKLGALNVNEAEVHHSHAAPGAPLGSSYSLTNDLDQTGKVSSFLSKVNGESRVPRSPRTPDLIDLPGRIVRAPRTRHSAPRNSPDIPDRLPEGEDSNLGTGALSDLNKGSGNMISANDVSRNVFPQRADQPALVRSNSYIDWNANNRKAMSDSGILALERSKTLMEVPSTSKPLNPVSPKDYVIPNLPMERSSTNPNFLDHSNRSGFQPFGAGTMGAAGQPRQQTHESPMASFLQRSNTTIVDGAGMRTGISPRQVEQYELKPGWNFRRMPSFHGNLPGGNMPPQRAEDIHEAQQAGISVPNSHMGRYLFTMEPTSNHVKSEGEEMSDPGSLKPRMPMYWLYGSRGRPNAPAHLALTLSNEKTQQFNDRASLGSSQFSDRDSVPKNLAETDFITAGNDRRDVYRSNYSSYEDQRKQREAEASIESITDQAGATFEGPALKSILKKTSAYSGGHTFAGVSSARMIAGPGGRLPHLHMKNNTRRVKFNFI